MKKEEKEEKEEASSYSGEASGWILLNVNIKGKEKISLADQIFDSTVCFGRIVSNK